MLLTEKGRTCPKRTHSRNSDLCVRLPSSTAGIPKAKQDDLWGETEPQGTTDMPMSTPRQRLCVRLPEVARAIKTSPPQVLRFKRG